MNVLYVDKISNYRNYIEFIIIEKLSINYHIN